MPILFWAADQVQWASGIPFSHVCFDSTWDSNSVFQTVTVPTRFISECEGYGKHNSSSHPRTFLGNMSCPARQERAGAGKIQPVPPLLCLTAETEGTHIVSTLSIYFRSELHFWRESPRYLSSLGAHKVDPFQMKLHQKMLSQKTTNTAQLLTSCGC